MKALFKAMNPSLSEGSFRICWVLKKKWDELDDSVLLVDKSTDFAHKKVLVSLNRRELAGLRSISLLQGLRILKQSLEPIMVWKINRSQTYKLWNCRHNNKMKYWITETLVLRKELLTGFSVNAFFHSSAKLVDASVLTLSLGLFMAGSIACWWERSLGFGGSQPASQLASPTALAVTQPGSLNSHQPLFPGPQPELTVMPPSESGWESPLCTEHPAQYPL